MYKRLIFGGESNLSLTTNLGFFLLRVFSGLALAFGHGIDKIPPSPKFIEITGKIGFPAPTLFAWAAGFSEFAGGLLLALGLFTRISGLFIAITMTVALFGVHFSNAFSMKEKALLFLFIGLAFMFKGAGNWSIDSLIRENR